MANSIPDDLDALLTRDRTAEALTEAGFPIKAKTLATKATRGGGPPFSKFGLRVLYRWNDALSWAEGRLTAPQCNTSEQDLVRQQAFATVPHSRTTENCQPTDGPARGRQL
jgi:hypothetical protein